MANARRKATAALVAAAAIMMVGRASAQDQPTAAPGLQEATIVLHVTNYAALSRDILDVASARVAMVYELIGVRTVWVDGEVSLQQRQDGRVHLSILLLSRDMAEKKIAADRIKDGVLAQAHLPSGRAHIFCERIATTPGLPRHFASPLGDVIAHEVGHLLLRTNGHSSTGIMRASMNVQAFHLRSFDKVQAHSIRTTLMELTADATGR
jgi:hypothetical protein